jgi:PAS domain-containing protein
VSLPIRVGTADGNKIVAAAFVEFSYVDGQFTFSNLVDQIVNSLLYALLISGIFLIFMYRWIEGSLNRTAKATEDALREGKTSLQLDIEWPALNRVIQEIGFCLTKAVKGTAGHEGVGVASGNGEWAAAAVRNTIKAAAAFDESLTVVAWNSGMAKIIGIQEHMAVGSDISLASRDVAFETAVRELAEEARASPWSPASRGIEFSGRPYRISMIHGAKHYLLNLDMEES